LVGVVFLFLPTLPVALWAMLKSLSALGGLSASVVHLLIDLLVGAAVGVVIGVIRWRRRDRSEVVEELVAAVGSPDVVNAARLSLSSALVHAAAGLAAGLAVALVGAHLAGILGGQSIVPGSAAASAFAAIGGGAGGGGGFEGTLSLLLSLLILLVLLGMLFGAAAAGGVAAIAGSSMSGATQGLGQGLGAALVLALTRLWNTELTPEARVARGLSPLTLSGAVDAYAGKPNTPPGPLIGRYLDWLAANGHPLDPPSVVAAFDAWARFLRERGRGNPPREVASFVYHVHAELARRAPEKRLAASTGAPALDGTPRTLLYPGWFRRSLLAGAAIGALAGALQALLVAAAFLLLGK
jgi:hypothetical protein